MSNNPKLRSKTYNRVNNITSIQSDMVRKAFGFENLDRLTHYDDNSTTYRVYADHLDTSRRVATNNKEAKVLWEWESKPFGESPANEDVDQDNKKFSLNLRFPGQYFDSETQTHYNINRDYNPVTGRYIQSDPIGFDGGVNSYVYVGGKPIIKVDPKGLDFDWSSDYQNDIDKVWNDTLGGTMINRLIYSKTKYKILNPTLGKMSSYSLSQNIIYLTPNVKIKVAINDGTDWWNDYFNSSCVYSTDIILFHEITHAYLDDVYGNPGSEMFVIDNYEDRYSGHNRVNHGGSYY